MTQWDLPMETFDPFRLWLHRPLVDLGDPPPAPTFLVHTAELDYRSMVEPTPRPRIQVSVNHSFRSSLATCTASELETGSPELRFGVADGLRQDRGSCLSACCT